MQQSMHLDVASVEDRLVERLAQELLGSDAGSVRLAEKLVSRLAHHLADRILQTPAEEPGKTLQQLVVEATAKELVRQQKASAREEDRLRLARSIRSPQAPHLMAELLDLVALEGQGKAKAARVQLLNKAFQAYGSFQGVLEAVEAVNLAPQTL